MSLGIANELSTPHLISNAFKNLAGLALGANYKLAVLDTLSAATTAKVEEKPKAEKKAEKKKEPEPEPEEEEDMGFGGLF